MITKNKNIPGAAVIIILLAAIVTGVYIKNRPIAATVSYNEFMNALALGEVSEVTLTDSALLHFRREPGGQEYSTDNPRRESFKEELLLKGVAVNESSATTNDWIQTGFTLLLAAGMIVYLRRRNSGLGANVSMSLGFSASDNNGSNAKKYSFSDVAGNDEAKESVADIVDFIADPEKYARFGARMPRGIILYGLPGTGKTLMAKAMAGEAGVPFYAVSGSDFIQMYVGVGAARVRELFKKARESGKAVIFIDEIDALGKKRGNNASGSRDEHDQTLNALLTEMSGFSENEGIVVVAATNRLDTLDEALLRPGRFDRHVEIGLPDVNARKKILALHAAGKPMSSEVDMEKWARDTVFFSGAMLEGLINESAIIAAKRCEADCTQEQITNGDIEKAYYITLAGYEKKDRGTVREQERRVTAYHEAGHALAAKLTSPENSVAKVSIIPGAKGIGGFCVNIPPEKMYYTKKELEQQIKIHIAGRCAEELIFGSENVTTGASNDIEKATRTIKKYIAEYGMSEQAGLLDMRTLPNDAALSRECKRMMNGLYADTLDLLRANQQTLNAVAEALLDREQIDEDELNKIIGLSTDENLLKETYF